MVPFTFSDFHQPFKSRIFSSHRTLPVHTVFAYRNLVKKKISAFFLQIDKQTQAVNRVKAFTVGSSFCGENLPYLLCENGN